MQTSTNVGFGTRVFPAVKLGTHHFPMGTIFRLNIDFCLEEFSGKEFEVKRIIRNDVRSFILETTTPGIRRIEDFYCVNIDHVDAIVKRGSGPVDVQAAGSCDEENEKHIQYILERIQSFKNYVVNIGVKVRKNEYVFSQLDSALVVWLFGKERIDCSLDSNIIWKHMEKSSVFKKTYVSEFDDMCIVVKKKAFKKWLKQNINRFYVSLDKLQKERDMIDQAMIEEMNDDSSWLPGIDTSSDMTANQNRIDDLVEKAWADEVFKELD